MAEDPSVFDLSTLTRTQFLLLEEWVSVFKNRDGIPDTRLGTASRVNAVWGKSTREFLAQLLEIFQGTKAAPPGLAGTQWRPGLDNSHNTFADDLTALSVPTAVGFWPMHNNAESIVDPADPDFEMVSSTTPALSALGFSTSNYNDIDANYAEKWVNNSRTHSTTTNFLATHQAAFALIGDMTFAATINPGFTSSEQRILDYGNLVSVTEVGAGDRLPYGLRLDSGDLSSSELADRILHYFHRDAGDTEQRYRAKFATDFSVGVPIGTESHIAFTRVVSGGSTTIEFFINGRPIGSENQANVPGAAGTGTNMRPHLGGGHGAKGKLEGTYRNAGIWSSVLTDAQILAVANHSNGIVDSA